MNQFYPKKLLKFLLDFANLNLGKECTHTSLILEINTNIYHVTF